MRYTFETRQQLAWEPDPTNNPVGRLPVKEGTNLPNSVTEDVGGFSLSPTYSAKQLRTIHRRRCKKEKFVRGNPKPKPQFGGRMSW